MIDSDLSVTGGAVFPSSPFDTTLLRENAPPTHAAVYFVGEGYFELFDLPMTLGTSFTHEQQVPTDRNAQGPPPDWQDRFVSAYATRKTLVLFGSKDGAIHAVKS